MNDSNSIDRSGAAVLQDFLIQLGADKVAHSGRSLDEHLCGVYKVLRAWKQPEHLCVAGMFHSIYSTERFHTALLTMSDRARLQGVIGEQAERLAFLFSRLSRISLFDSEVMRAPASLDLPCHWDHQLFERVTGTEIRELTLLHLANRLEQSAKPATGIGFWLSDTSQQVAMLRDFGHTLPTVLAELPPVSVNSERQLHSYYLQGLSRLQEGTTSDALQYLGNACSACSSVAEPYLLLGVAHRLLENAEQAKKDAARGRSLMQAWGAPWHKHLSLERWCRLADLIEADAPIDDLKAIMREISVAYENAQARIATRYDAGSSESNALSPPEQAGAPRFFAYLRAIQTSHSRRAIKWYPGLSRKPWYDPNEFDVARELAGRFERIKEEVLKVSKEYYYEEAEKIGRTGSWQVCMFYEQGRKNDAVCGQCPTTTAILEGFASVRRTAGLIYLSKMAAHTHVATHQARNNIRLRCHLALSIPEGDCAIRVGDEVHRWEEGKCIVFDDTYDHEVWNRTDQERLVLLVDLWHPDLTSIERDAMDAINWLSLQRANEMLGTWQRNDREREKEGKAVPK